MQIAVGLFNKKSEDFRLSIFSWTSGNLGKRVGLFDRKDDFHGKYIFSSFLLNDSVFEKTREMIQLKIKDHIDGNIICIDE